MHIAPRINREESGPPAQPDIACREDSNGNREKNCSVINRESV